MCGCCELQCIEALLPFSFPMSNTRTNSISCSDCHQQSSMVAILVFLKQCPLFLWWLSSSKPQLPYPGENVSSCLFLFSVYVSCIWQWSFLLHHSNMVNLIHTNSTRIQQSATSQQRNIFLSKAKFWCVSPGSAGDYLVTSPGSIHLNKSFKKNWKCFCSSSLISIPGEVSLCVIQHSWLSYPF